MVELQNIFLYSQDKAWGYWRVSSNADLNKKATKGPAKEGKWKVCSWPLANPVILVKPLPKKREPHSLSGRDFQPSQIDSDPPTPYQEVSEPRLATRMVPPTAQQSVYTRTTPCPTFCSTTVMRTMCHRFQQGSSSFTNSHNKQLLFLSVLFTENGSKQTVIS